MEGEGFAEGEAREGADVIDDAVGKGGCGSDKKNGIVVDESGDVGNVHAVGWSGACYEVDFDAEIGAGFEKSRMGGLGDNPR